MTASIDDGGGRPWRPRTADDDIDIDIDDNVCARELWFDDGVNARPRASLPGEASSTVRLTRSEERCKGQALGDGLHSRRLGIPWFSPTGSEATASTARRRPPPLSRCQMSVSARCKGQVPGDGRHSLRLGIPSSPPSTGMLSLSFSGCHGTRCGGVRWRRGAAGRAKTTRLDWQRGAALVGAEKPEASLSSSIVIG